LEIKTPFIICVVKRRELFMSLRVMVCLSLAPRREGYTRELLEVKAKSKFAGSIEEQH